MIGRRDDPSRERTPEERARAAAERAARRAGEPLPPAPPAEAPAPAPPAPKPVPAAPPESIAPRAPEPEPVAPPAREPMPAAPPARAPEPDAPPAPEPVAAGRRAPRRAVREEPRAPAREDAPAPLPRRTAPLPGARRRPPAPPRPPRSAYARATGGFAGRRILAVAGLLGILAALWVINATFQPFHGDPEGRVEVTIPPGSDVGRIGELLAERGVIDSPTFFNLNATITGRRGDLRAGDYELPRNMSNGQAIDALVQGPKVKVVPTFEITIPEGRSRREVVPIVKDSDVTGDYLAATQSPKALARARKLGLPKDARSVEGFLFPATYQLVRPSPASDLVAKQLDAFQDNLAEVDLRAAKDRKLTRYDVVIIASMIEREAQLDRERPLVSAVIHNRLRAGMPLGIDATIRYAENNWTRPLLVSELERDTPYNTRLNRGLPPTPIGNPGLASLKAAAAPADEDYLFYVVKPGTCGEHAFSSSDAQFERDVARYDAAREQAGGKSPTTCSG